MANRRGKSGNGQIFFSWAPKSLQTVTAAMKLKDVPWKESYDKTGQCIKKQSHHFTNKGPQSQSSGFSRSPVWLWATIKKAECRRIGAFKLCCRRRLLRVPWTPRRSNQSILKEISSEYSLEGLMLKFQYFCPLMLRAYLLENILILGKIEGRRRG